MRKSLGKMLLLSYSRWLVSVHIFAMIMLQQNRLCLSTLPKGFGTSCISIIGCGVSSIRMISFGSRHKCLLNLLTGGWFALIILKIQEAQSSWEGDGMRWRWHLVGRYCTAEYCRLVVGAGWWFQIISNEWMWCSISSGVLPLNWSQSI